MQAAKVLKRRGEPGQGPRLFPRGSVVALPTICASQRSARDERAFAAKISAERGNRRNRAYNCSEARQGCARGDVRMMARPFTSLADELPSGALPWRKLCKMRDPGATCARLLDRAGARTHATTETAPGRGAARSRKQPRRRAPAGAARPPRAAPRRPARDRRRRRAGAPNAGNRERLTRGASIPPARVPTRRDEQPERREWGATGKARRRRRSPDEKPADRAPWSGPR
jgi:hypothetical protein